MPAARIANKGNIIVLDEEGWDSYIYNKITEKSIPIRQENNVYVLDVEYMTEDKGEYVEVAFEGRRKWLFGTGIGAK